MALQEWKPRITFSCRVNRVLAEEQPTLAQVLLVEYARHRYHLVACKVEGAAIATPPVVLSLMRIPEDKISAKSLPSPSTESFVMVTSTYQVFSFGNPQNTSEFENAMMNAVAKANLAEEDVQLRNKALTYEAVSDFTAHGESDAAVSK